MNQHTRGVVSALLGVVAAGFAYGQLAGWSTVGRAVGCALAAGIVAGALLMLPHPPAASR